MVNSYPGYISLDDILVDIGECNSPGEAQFIITILWNLHAKLRASIARWIF